MNVNKKFDRLKQWGKERMGGESKTDTTDDFKALELEMQLRHEGMERLKKSSDVYIQHMGKRDKYHDKDFQLPVGFFGSAMVSHGDDFEPDSEFGQCLSVIGRANERIARLQETYCANATSSWLESLERSLVQMKEYQRYRKQLESRRLAYDAASAKMQRLKREDFRMEEELRSQKMKYEESSDDVYRRMLDIKEAEVESVQDLTSFLEAELTYHDRCREILMQVKREWPAQAVLNNRSGTSSPVNGGPMRRSTRSRANSVNDRFGRIEQEEPLQAPARPTLGSRIPSATVSPRTELPGFDLSARPNMRSSSTPGFEGPTTLPHHRTDSPVGMPRLARVPTEPSQIAGALSNLRVTKSREPSISRNATTSNVFGDEQSDSSDFTAQDDPSSAMAAWSTTANDGSTTKKAPPPPPSRMKKPPPPPPPLKRSALSTSEVPRY